MNKFYLWKKKSSCTYPWQRKFLNRDFLKYEKNRIEKVSKWFHKFQRLKTGSSLGEIYYYVTPLELSSRWKVAIASKGSYNYVGLSALKNCLQVEIIMLIPEGVKIPLDYSLIRIVSSKKDFIHDEKSNEVKYVIISDDYEQEDPSYVYVDVPFERRGISKFIKENMINDDTIASSFQSTISGAPYVVNGKGGISYSAIMGKTSFSEELMSTLKMMQPLEFSDIQSQLSSKIIEGKNILSSNGMRYHIAERSIPGRNYYSAFASKKYSRLNSELVKREMFNGEYSISCALNQRGENASELLQDALSKFVKTEVMQFNSIDELKNWDIDLFRTQKNIDEDLWLQVVHQKHLKPVVQEGLDVSKFRKKMLQEWEIIFDSLALKNTNHQANSYSKVSLSNVLKIAQSMSRDVQENFVSETSLSRAFRLFTQNAESLRNNELIQRQAQVLIPEQYKSPKFNAVQAELSVNMLNVRELFENVKVFFKDMYELQDYIDKKLLVQGFLYEPKRGYYKWH